MAKTIKTIIAIGGGKLKELETLKIDREIVKLTEKTHPTALFIPPPSRDVSFYWKIFQTVYGKKLGCKTMLLDLHREAPTQKEISDKILSSDLIYVAGGNSLSMMKKWRTLGVDELLRKAYNRGIILSGISAGSICWFKYGLSNSQKFYNREKWNYIRVRGLGWIPATNCPHYNDEKRDKDFENMIKKSSGIGIALDANCALELINDKYRIITSRNDAQAYRVYKKKGKLITEKIEQTKAFIPLRGLLVY